MLVVTPRIQIPLDDFQFQYARSGGPGGQNVYKVNSKAILRWQLVGSPTLPEDVRDRFVATFGSRLTAAGELLIASEESRDQLRNKELCLEKLSEMLLAVAKPPKARRATKPSKGSIRRRLETKQQNSQRKANRKPPGRDE
jgi:ribosome-associated protein